MTTSQIETLPSVWRSVARQLSERLLSYQGTSSVLAAVPMGGLELGYHLSTLLHLPLEIIPCKRIQHPSRKETSIGSVSLNETVIHDYNRQIPQDYVSHQIILTRQGLYNRYHELTDRQQHNLFENKPVIVVDDMIRTGDTMLACIKSIRKQNPLEIVAVTPLASPRGMEEISDHVERTVCLQSIRDERVLLEYYRRLPKTHETDIETLLLRARAELIKA